MIQVLDAAVLQPLLLIFGFLFELLPHGLGVGGRLVACGILLNLGLLPVYRQIEARSRTQRAATTAVESDIKRIKKHFKGRERYFYVRAVHRQHGYHPARALLASGDLAIQMLVFATAYRYLSHLQALEGSSFGPVLNLAQPDGLLAGINLLPLLMTAANAAAVLLHSRDVGRRVMGLSLAALFLVLLYGSPAGLLLYWTTNNLFSLAMRVLPTFRRAAAPSDAPRPASLLSGQT